MRLLSRLEVHARERPAAPALRISQGSRDARIVTYRELHDRVTRVAALLQSHGDGAVVAISLQSSPEFASAYLAALSAGQIVHPIPHNASGPELRAFLERTGAAALVGDAEACAHATGTSVDIISPQTSGTTGAKRKEVDGDKPGLYLPSSGTTGLPKIAVRSRKSLDAVAANVALAAGLTPDDSVLAGVPMSHSYGMENGLLGPIWAGSCIHIVEHGAAGPGAKLDVGELVDELGMGGITVLPGVPFMIDMLAQLARGEGRPSKLRLAYTAGSPLPDSVAAGFESRFGLEVGQLYGATEVGSVTFAHAGACVNPKSVGRPLPGVDIVILDTESPSIASPLAMGSEGQVAIKAESMLSHYLGGDRSDPAFIGDYFLMGDLGRIESDGALTITGRLKLLIDVGGFKVNPLEVEQTMAQHPSIGEVVVVPVPISETVSRLRAVVTSSGRGDVPIEEVRAFVRARLAPHKVPRIIDVVRTLPKSPTGKILRRQLETDL